MNGSAVQPKRQPVADVITDLALAMNQAVSVPDVQRLVVERAVSVMGGQWGSVMMPPEQPGPMRVVATTGRARNSGAELPESPVAEWVVEHDEPVLLIGRSGPLAHLLHREDIRDAVCVPLRYAGRTVGALSVSNSHDRPPFHPGDVDLLTSIGHLAAVALRNTMLYREANEHRERVQAVLHRLWKAEEEERRRMAADLHDGPGQSLFHIVFRLQTVRKEVEANAPESAAALAQAEEAAREALRQLRAVMAGLRPMSLDDLGLVPALRSECAAMTARGRVRVDVTVAGRQRRLPDATETGIYHIAREALINVERHSGSPKAHLELRFNASHLTVSVSDHGLGFDADTLRKARMAGHIGLTAMRERAEALGMSLSTESRAGEGTRVLLHCPLEQSG